ncbi:MAG: hypothetical protein FWE63_08385 [Bacteroidales bacterium]|nr:hypothetical protein [Bacteroidales bacterium]
MKKLLYLAAILIAVGTSCIKKEYDLNRDNLDLTITFSEDGLWLPIGATDTMRLENFLNPDSVDLLEILNGAYAIVLADSNKIEVDIDTEQLVVDDILVETYRDTIYFDNVLNFPDVTISPVALDTVVNSEFWLPDGVIALLSLPISVDTLNATLASNPLFDPFIPLLPKFPIPLSASGRDTVPISIEEELTDDLIVGVDTIWLTNSYLQVIVTPQNIPFGTTLTLDSLLLVFPPQVKLGMSEGFVSDNVYLVRNKQLIGSTTLTIPIRCLASLSLSKSQTLKIEDEIQVFTKYNLSGVYSGGFFPNNENNSTRLDLNISSNLNFGSAIVRLRNVYDSLPKTAFPVDINVGIPEEIIAIDSIIFQNTKVSLDLKLSQTKIQNQTMNIRVRVQFPQSIIFSDPRIQPGNIFDNNVTFTNNRWNPTFDVRGLTFTDQTFSGDSINIRDSITVEAWVVLNNPTVNTDTLRHTAIAASVDAAITNIKFSKIYGKINPEIPTENFSMDLLDLPGILINNRDSIIFDVKPYLDLVLNSNLQVPFGTDLVLTPYKNGVPGAKQQVSINVPASLGGMNSNKFWIADTITQAEIDRGYTWVQTDLGTIIRRIPDSIQISINTNVDTTKTAIFDLNAQYRADLDYKFVVPFAFGDSLQFVIQDTIEVPKEIGQYLNGNHIELYGIAWNSIPLMLEATIIPIDSNGIALEIAKYPTFVIGAGNGTDAAIPSTLKIVFDDSDSRVLTEMRGMVFRFNGGVDKNTIGVPLKPDNFIRVELKAKVIGGLTIDLNNLLD